MQGQIDHLMVCAGPAAQAGQAVHGRDPNFAAGAAHGALAMLENRTQAVAENVIEGAIGTPDTMRLMIEFVLLADYDRDMYKPAFDERFGRHTGPMLMAFVATIERSYRVQLDLSAASLRAAHNPPGGATGFRNAPESYAIDLTEGILPQQSLREDFYRLVLLRGFYCILAAQQFTREGLPVVASRGRDYALADIGMMTHTRRLDALPAAFLRQVTAHGRGDRTSSTDSDEYIADAARLRREPPRPINGSTRCHTDRCRSEELDHHYLDCPYRRQNQSRQDRRRHEANRRNKKAAAAKKETAAGNGSTKKGGDKGTESASS